ncbi:MAG TPA: 50S ribosomal protein L1, partial [Candidatus Binatus sp.]|nr:50S ribosomal protein L1 [Candidatus Binatus sp.]
MEELKGKTPKRKFNQAIEMQVKLRDVDLKKPESRIQEMVELPDPADKNIKVAVIAGGDLATRAREAGADAVIGKDTLDKVAREKKEARKIANAYDFFVAEAPLMPQVGRSMGQILGPRGKMPIPVPPTVQIADVIKRQRRNVRIRMKDQPVLQAKVGTEDMPTDAIVRNVQAVLARIEAKA